MKTLKQCIEDRKVRKGPRHYRDYYEADLTKALTDLGLALCEPSPDEPLVTENTTEEKAQS